MKEIKVDSDFRCPFRQTPLEGDNFSYCLLEEFSSMFSRKNWRCLDLKTLQSKPAVPLDCPLRKDSIIVNIGSLGLTDSKGLVK